MGNNTTSLASAGAAAKALVCMSEGPSADGQEPEQGVTPAVHFPGSKQGGQGGGSRRPSSKAAVTAAELEITIAEQP